MSSQFDRDELFEDYFRTALEIFGQMELVFGVEGVRQQIFGVVGLDTPAAFGGAPGVETARARVRESDAWRALSELYDYAVDGVVPDHEHGAGLVLEGAEILSFLEIEDYRHSADWTRIVSLGDGRYALDTGEDIALDKLALLAGVDPRTVRNAISSGELVSYKNAGVLYIQNASARHWLSGRRGFKPTRVLARNVVELSSVSTPAELGAYLAQRRAELELAPAEPSLVAAHPAIGPKTVAELEGGAFRLPLDAAFPLADFYQLDRHEFLASLMRVFFPDELKALLPASQAA